MYICSFVHSCITLAKITSNFCVKVSQNGYISTTTHQKAFIFGPWVPWRVCFRSGTGYLGKCQKRIGNKISMIFSSCTCERNMAKTGAADLMNLAFYTPPLPHPHDLCQGYIVFVFPFFCLYVCMFVCPFFRYINKNYVKVLR